MSFGSVIGMLLFTVVINEIAEKMNPQPSEDEQKIIEIKNELKRQDVKNEELKKEIEKLKNEIDNLKE